jgi:hypothetical protein
MKKFPRKTSWSGFSWRLGVLAVGSAPDFFAMRGVCAGNLAASISAFVKLQRLVLVLDSWIRGRERGGGRGRFWVETPLDSFAEPV